MYSLTNGSSLIYVSVQQCVHTNISMYRHIHNYMFHRSVQVQLYLKGRLSKIFERNPIIRFKLKLTC